MSEFDSKALASTREVMALTRQEHIGGDAQLIAKIQLLFVDAMEYAAPQSFGNSEQLERVSQAYTLRDGLEAIRKLGPIDTGKIQAERDALNEPTCWCLTCRPVTMTDMRFVVCPDCGNKRCPKANDHSNACSGSNEPGQEGSAYPAAPKQERE